jgi:hypothetical protein
MNAAAVVGSAGTKDQIEDFGWTVAEVAACRARVGVARRLDLTVDVVAATDGPQSQRLGPGAWTISDCDRTIAVRRADEADGRAPAADDLVLSVIGPRLRRLLRSCGASVPTVGDACRTLIGTTPVWVLTEAEQHALIVVSAADAPSCCRVLERHGAALGCIFVGQAALRRLAAARVVTLV